METDDGPVQKVEVKKGKFSRFSSLKDGFWGNAFLAFMVAWAVFAAEVYVDNQRSERTEQVENLRFVRERSSASEQPRPFHGMNLNGQNLSGLNLNKADFREANLEDAVFREANLEDAVFREADLRQVDFGFVDVCGINFQGADLRDAFFGDFYFEKNHINSSPGVIECPRKTEFNGADLRKTTFTDATLENADFSAARFGETSFHAGNLRNAFFGSADLRKVEFDMYVLDNADFSSADLRGVDFYSGEQVSINPFFLVTITGADFTAADLRGVDFWGTDLRGADFSRAKIGLSPLQKLNPRHWDHRPFEGALFDENTIWPEGFTVPERKIADLRWEENVWMVSYGDEGS